MSEHKPHNRNDGQARGVEADTSGRFAEAVPFADEDSRRWTVSSVGFSWDGSGRLLVGIWAPMGHAFLAHAREMLARRTTEKPFEAIAHRHVQVLRAAIDRPPGEFARTIDQVPAS